MIKAIGFYPLFNMRKHEILEVKEQFAARGFRYVATARSVNELKEVLAKEDIKIIAIKDFNANWDNVERLRLVMSIGQLRKWFHVDLEDFRLLDQIKEEIEWEQQQERMR
ncbi:hypothetical protein [Paenibacillus xylanexedens]|uniref:hypothetical protein n=1 Tax=Paenibacillus xylanexedens TaxID=528191 RepID=UPI0011A6B399|nr:hypothetical protein [Paenibacillus xylanexedens]